jgi:ATP-dependent 26S proteasome regulatory subunit
MTESQLNIDGKMVFNSDFYINKNISEIVMTYIKTFDNKTKKTIKDVAIGVGILITAEIIKSIVLDFLREQKKQVNEGLMTIIKEVKIFPILMNIFTFPYRMGIYTSNIFINKFNRMFYKKKEEENDIEIIVDETETFTIESTQIFVSNLLRYIKTNENCTYNKKYDKNFTLNKNNVNTNTIYSNISINFENININIDNTFTKNENEIIFNCNDLDENIFEKVMDKYYKNTILKNVTIQTSNYENVSIYSINDKLYTYYKCNNNESSFGNCIFTLCLKKFYSDISNDKYHNYTDNILALAAYISHEICKYYFIKNPVIKEKIINIFNKKMNKNIDHTKLLLEYEYRASIYIDNYEYCKVNCTTANVNLFCSKTELKDFLESNEVTDVKKANTTTKILMNIKLLEKEHDNNLQLNVKKFITHINNLSLQSMNSKKIKIYTLKIEKELCYKTIINPKYEKYVNDKKELLEENKDIKKERIIDLLGTEPEKEHSNEYINKTVKLNTINERFSSFDNLYLSKRQDVELCELYSSFNEDKEKMTSLGIPNKLCILLHGEPGTGKTTTIITTASYFGKDIFYISLKNISNEDLKMMFDFIHEKHTNSGIIIFEDFDAMTNVVKKREIETNYSLVGVTEEINENLTLDYFLNLLDGTLTCDGSIIMMTTNYIENIDKAIYRAGRVDSIIEMKKSDHYQITKIFKRFIDRDIDNLILNRIKEYTFTPAEIIFRLKYYVKRKNESDEEMMKPFLHTA